ncbi:PPE family protein [Mycobacterium sp. Marseille-P9652]|uniref:PPE family protein n=1 Tax=Mycobacterium sp. Marseille-P9652 TaxID=2654950 RepID=UPI0012E80AB6|nr:PPE family protein [Mycobacterium sp. Marseille-P9652]
MADPGWAARTPEDNDLLLKAGTGVATQLANQTAWTALGAAHHASGVASAINTAATSMSWLGAGSAASAANVTMLNASLHGLAGWVDVKPAVVATAISAYEMANAAMRPAPECIANRDEWGVDNGINPSVLWTLTPRIISLDVEYFGVMWPNNSAVGASYGAILTALAESLAIAPPIATMGASPAAPAQAASAVGQAAAEAAAGDGMRAAFQGAQTGTSGAGQAASTGQGMGDQLGTFMQPVQTLMGAVPQALQAPAQLMQAPMSAMQPLQSMMGMFANPGALGMGGATPGVSAASAAGGISAAEAGASAGAGGGGAALGGAGVPATTFTRPVSAFEPATGGRPVGLRPSGALGADAVRPQTTTAVGGTPMGGMPVGHGGGGQRGSNGKSEQPATVRVVDARV